MLSRSQFGVSLNPLFRVLFLANPHFPLPNWAPFLTYQFFLARSLPRMAPPISSPVILPLNFLRVGSAFLTLKPLSIDSPLCPDPFEPPPCDEDGAVLFLPRRPSSAFCPQHLPFALGSAFLTLFPLLLSPDLCLKLAGCEVLTWPLFFHFLFLDQASDFALDLGTPNDFCRLSHASNAVITPLFFPFSSRLRSTKSGPRKLSLPEAPLLEIHYHSPLRRPRVRSLFLHLPFSV